MMQTGKPITRITGVTAILPGRGEALEGRDILLRGGRIEAVAPAGRVKKDGALDGEGLFAIPGLVDTHVHALGLFTENLPDARDIGWVARQQLKNLAAFLRAGVTTVRDMGAPVNLIRLMSGLAERGEIKSPRILFAGPVLTVEGGYPYFIPGARSLVERVTGPVCVRLRGEAHARRAVDRLAAAGVHCIKVCLQSEKYDDARSPLRMIPEDWLRAIIARAHRRGLPVAAHVVYAKDLAGALDLPFDSIEHVVIDGKLTDEAAARAAEKDVPMCATMMTYGLIDHLDRCEALLRDDPGRFEAKPREFFARAVETMRRGESASGFIGKDCITTGSKYIRMNVKKLRETGVTIVNGTDSGGAITPAGCPHWELLDMVRAGMSELDALRAATTDAARALGRPRLGSLAPGAAADIVLLRGNPLENIAAVSGVAAVIRGGRLAHRAKRR